MDIWKWIPTDVKQYWIEMQKEKDWIRTTPIDAKFHLMNAVLLQNVLYIDFFFFFSINPNVLSACEHLLNAS